MGKQDLNPSSCPWQQVFTRDRQVGTYHRRTKPTFARCPAVSRKDCALSALIKGKSASPRD